MNYVSFSLFVALTVASSTGHATTDATLDVGPNIGGSRSSFAFDLPDARGRYQPSLAVRYAGTGPVGEAGAGWALTTSYIEGSSRAPLAANGGLRDEFTVVRDGTSALFIRTGTTTPPTYRPVLGDGWVSAQWSVGSTTLVDAVGTTYVFTTRGARRYLSSVVDVDGNTTTFEYTDELGVTLLRAINYNVIDPNNPTSTVNPTAAPLTYATRVELVYTTGASDLGWRAAERRSYLASVLIERRQSTGAYATIRGYSLTYATSPSSDRWRLAGIDRTGVSGSGVQLAARFTYTDTTPTGFGAAQSLPALGGPANLLSLDPASCRLAFGLELRALPPACRIADVATWADLDGDKRPDLVWTTASSAGGGAGLRWARNLATPDNGPAFAAVQIAPGSESFAGTISSAFPSGETVAKTTSSTTTTRFVDVDGDHRPDLVSTSASCGPAALSVQRNVPGTSAVTFAAPVCLDATAAMPDWYALNGCSGTCKALPIAYAPPPALNATSVHVMTDLVDMTGDGFLDLVIAQTGGLKVFPGYRTASGLAFAAGTLYPASLAFDGKIAIQSSGEAGLGAQLLDVNGDRLPDRVVLTTGGAGWFVEYNTGAGFARRDTVTALRSATAPDSLAAPSSGFLADLDRDGHVDWIEPTTPCAGSTAMSWSVRRNTGLQLAAPRCVPGPEQYAPSQREIVFAGDIGVDPEITGSNGSLVDVDGDGAVDYVAADANGAWRWFPSREALSVPPDTLASIRNATGRVTTIAYLPSSVFDVVAGGDIYPVVSEVTISGPAIAPVTTRQWYASYQVATAWDPALGLEGLGFGQVVTQDSATLQIRRTWFSTIAAFGGAPIKQQVWTGAAFASGHALPSGSELLAESTYTPTAKSLATSTCSTAPTSGFPMLVFDADTTRRRFDGGVAFASRETVACGDVDAAGNVTRAYVDDDTSTGGDERYVYSTFDVTATCKTCPLETWANTGLGQPDLFHRYVHYDAAVGTYDSPRNTVSRGHLNYTEQLVAGSGAGGRYEIASKTRYSANGNVAATRSEYAGQDVGSIETTLTYDPYQLAVARIRTADSPATTALVAETVIDPATGRALASVGPYVEGTTAGPRIAFAYDTLGRVRATARQDIANNVATAALVAYDYVDAAPSQPGRTTVYTFATNRSISLPSSLAPLSIPASDDVSEVITYFDGHGRAIQSRQRLGRGGAAAGGANIVQSLDANTYRVSASVYDAAGRTIATLDPYYASGGGFADVASGAELATPDLHVTRIGYDRRGRAVCTVYSPVAGNLAGGTLAAAPSSPDTCRTDATHLATSMRYGAETVVGRPYQTTEVTPAWLNIAALPFAPTRIYTDAAGRTGLTRDAYGNFEQSVFDNLGRDVARVRYAGPVGTTPQVAITRTYDLRGRLVQQRDASSGTTDYVYAPTGEVIASSRNPTADTPTGAAGTTSRLGSLGRVVERASYTWVKATSCLWERKATIDATYAYDLPFGSGASYGRVGGRLASVTNSIGTIAFGYDDDGNVTRHDTWLAAMPGALHSVQHAYAHDGRMLSTTIASPALQSPVGSVPTYDSAGRLAELGGTGTTYWRAGTGAAVPATGWYDAANRLTAAREDSDHVQVAATFSPTSNLPTSESIMLVGQLTVPVYDLTAMQYTGGKLTGFRDNAGRTTYAMSYDHDGRLTRATATPDAGAPAPAQRYDEEYSFLLDGSFATGASTAPSLWNLQAVRATTPSGSATSTYLYAPGTERLASVTTTGALQPDLYRYDSRGRGLVVARAKSPDQTPPEQSFGYDGLDRLTKIALYGTTEETLAYGPAGELAQRTLASGEKRLYVGDDLTIIVRGTTTIGQAHVRLAGKRLASVWTKSSAGTVTTGAFYYHRDRLGSVIATSRAGGALGMQYRYGPYGAKDAPIGTPADDITSELGYTGGLELSGGIVHLGARDYDPRGRRFLQPDTIDARRYTYASGDPANYTDPSGRYAVINWASNQPYTTWQAGVYSGAVGPDLYSDAIGYDPGPLTLPGSPEGCIVPGWFDSSYFEIEPVVVTVPFVDLPSPKVEETEAEGPSYEDLLERIEHLEGEIETLEGEKEELEDDRAKRKEENARLRKENAQKDQRIASLARDEPRVTPSLDLKLVSVKCGLGLPLCSVTFLPDKTITFELVAKGESPDDVSLLLEGKGFGFKVSANLENLFAGQFDFENGVGAYAYRKAVLKKELGNIGVRAVSLLVDVFNMTPAGGRR